VLTNRPIRVTNASCWTRHRDEQPVVPADHHTAYTSSYPTTNRFLGIELAAVISDVIVTVVLISGITWIAGAENKRR
jgi:hypothetical protein